MSMWVGKTRWYMLLNTQWMAQEAGSRKSHGHRPHRQIRFLLFGIDKCVQHKNIRRTSYKSWGAKGSR